MKLIDLEKINLDNSLIEIITDMINQPIIDAIPVEWIEKQIQKALTVDNASIFYSRNLKYLIEEWEKENERY